MNAREIHYIRLLGLAKIFLVVKITNINCIKMTCFDSMVSLLCHWLSHATMSRIMPQNYKHNWYTLKISFKCVTRFQIKKQV